MPTNLISFNFNELNHLLVLTVFHEIFRFFFLVCKILSSSNKNNILPSVSMFYFFFLNCFSLSSSHLLKESDERGCPCLVTDHLRGILFMFLLLSIALAVDFLYMVRVYMLRYIYSFCYQTLDYLLENK